jgi:hypothetical protein
LWATKRIGQVQAALEVAQQVQDLRLDRDVEGRHRLVGHQQLGVDGQGPAMPMRWRWPPLN